MGLSYHTHFLKSRGSVFRNNFLECRNKQATLFARQNYLYALFASNKANIYSIGIFRAPVVTQFILKVLGLELAIDPPPPGGILYTMII